MGSENRTENVLCLHAKTLNLVFVENLTDVQTDRNEAAMGPPCLFV